MAFSDFTLLDVRDKLGLTVVMGTLFPDASPVTLPAWLTDWLDSCMPLATAMGTEKGRSELLISPLLIHAYKLAPSRPTFFSGVEFNVDPAAGLKGFCDFLFSLSPDQFLPDAPVIVVVEAKNDNYAGALPQCIAEMYAASLFNRSRGRDIESVYGVISTGLDWNFLRLIGAEVVYDSVRYGLRDAPTIVAILLEMLEVPIAPIPAAPIAEVA